MGSRSGKLRLLIVRHGETDCNVQGIIQGQLDTDLNDVGRRQARFVGSALQTENINEVYSSPLRRAKDTADAIVAANPNSHAEGLSYWVDDRLKERGFGSLEGRSFDRSKPKRDSIDGIEQMKPFIARLGSFLGDVLTQSAPFSSAQENQNHANSEWVDETITRQASVSQDFNGINNSSSNVNSTKLDSAGSSRTILIVAHGAAISALVGDLLMDMGLAKIAAKIQRSRIWNCSITQVSVDTSQLPIKNGKVDIQRLVEEASRTAFVIERWADVRHLPDELDDAVDNKGNADEMVGKSVS